MVKVSSLAEALEQIRQGCTELDLTDNKIGAEGAKELAAALKANTTVTTLALYGNGIGDEGAKELAAALKANKTLTTLALSFDGIGDEGAKELAAALKTNATLAELLLGDNKIGAEGAKELAAALKANRTLTALTLWGNRIGDEGAKELAAALKANATLTSLFLIENRIGDEGAKELAAALKANATLTSLFLIENRIGDEGAKELAAALKANATLTSLFLTGNGIGDEGAKELAAALKDNTTLTTLELSGNGVNDQAALATIESILDDNKVRPPASAGQPAAAGSSSSAGPSAAAGLKRTRQAYTAVIEEYVQSMNRHALVEALETLGEPTATGENEHQLRERLLELIDPEGADPVGYEEALVAARRRCLRSFLVDCGRTERDAARVADGRLEGRVSAADFCRMWDDLLKEYCPPAPAPPDRSSSEKVLVIAPGFGFRANSAQILVLERAFGAAIVRSNQHASPEEPGFDMSECIKRILQEIGKHKPKAILCASKGGQYMEELWRRMEAGGHDHLKGIGYLMINIRPGLTRLPLGVKVIVVQGAKEEKWHRERGYDKHGKVQDGPWLTGPPPPKRVKGSLLEELIRTGSPGLCYLYYTADEPRGVRHRKGDTHDPASLLQYDCLPRLVDALLSSSLGSVGSIFQASSRAFVSAERMAAENSLGWHLETLPERFVGDVQLAEVQKGSEEFKNVETIFKADPAEGVERFYFTNRGTGHLDVTKIERVQNNHLRDSVDNTRGRFKELLERSGEQYVAGVHSRWVFHGARDEDVLEDIISDPMRGFKPEASLGDPQARSLWGHGSYFARDAAYCVHAGYGANCRDNERNRMILLCLVECGLSCVGEGHMNIGMAPKTHQPPDKPGLPYGSFVDYASNPEIFVTMGEQAYPAYIIHFKD